MSGKTFYSLALLRMAYDSARRANAVGSADRSALTEDALYLVAAQMLGGHLHTERARNHFNHSTIWSR
jgi:hypothetical protein